MNEVLRKLLLVITIIPFLITGCATHTDYSLIIDSERIKGFGFSIPLPLEPGWKVITETNKSIYLAKFGENIDETYAILIDVNDSFSLNAIDGKNDKEKLENFSKEIYLREFTSRRYQAVTYEKMVNMPTNENCVRSYAKVIDLEAIKKSSNPDSLYMDIYELVCLHPYIPDSLVRIGYSHRYYSQQSGITANFEDEVIDFTNSIVWEKPYQNDELADIDTMGIEPECVRECSRFYSECVSNNHDNINPKKHKNACKFGYQVCIIACPMEK